MEETDDPKEPNRDESDTCKNHPHVELDRQGKCHICQLLKGRNRKYTR